MHILLVLFNIALVVDEDPTPQLFPCRQVINTSQSCDLYTSRKIDEVTSCVARGQNASPRGHPRNAWRRDISQIHGHARHPTVYTKGILSSLPGDMNCSSLSERESDMGQMSNLRRDGQQRKGEMASLLICETGGALELGGGKLSQCYSEVSRISAGKFTPP